MTTWSGEQEAIFRWVEAPGQHLVVEARAGSGKTFSAVEASRRIPKGASAIFLAFNVDRKDDLLAKAPRSVDVRTINSLGNRACQNARGRRVTFDRDKGLKIARRLIPHASWKDMMLLRRAIGVAKATLSHGDVSIDAALDDYGLDIPKILTRERFVAAILAALRVAREDQDTIDYDDQIWHPLIHDYRVDQYDWVIIDEGQDTSLPQLNLALKAIRPGGHFLAFSDPFQALYKFAGADGSSIESLKLRFKVDTLPLTTTYRCAKSIVREAARMVPDIRALPSAKEGKVSRVALEDMRPRPGDYVLSRKTAPLVTLAINAIRRGERAEVRGQKFGDDLAGFIEAFGAENVPALRADVTAWCVAEIARLEKRGRDTAGVADRRDVVLAVAEGAVSIENVKSRVKKLFSDEGSHDNIVFSTVHRAKGGERDRVWMLEDTFMPLAEVALDCARHQQEANLRYVAITRAREELFYVEGKV